MAEAEVAAHCLAVAFALLVAALALGGHCLEYGNLQWPQCGTLEDVPLAVELRDGDPVE